MRKNGLLPRSIAAFELADACTSPINIGSLYDSQRDGTQSLRSFPHAKSHPAPATFGSVQRLLSQTRDDGLGVGALNLPVA
jgi:hypothetical protein